MNATPTQIILWPGAMAGDFYNPMNGSIYTVHRYYVPTEKRIVTRSYHTWENVTTTEAEFVKWCESIHCASIFQVPGETNNSAMAAWMVNYTENTLGFHPTYWEIGNEPQLWKMYNVSWTKWPIQNSTLPTSKVTPSGYAWLVHNFTVAMRAVDPKIKIIGLPAAGRPDPLPVEDWVAPVVAVDGPDISVIAYHDYPAGNALPGSPTLQNFYAAINGSAGLNGRIAEIRGGIQNGSNPARYPLTTCTAACAANISLFVTEFGTALSHQEYGPWSVAFPGALDYAAQVTQAMDLNVSNVDVFGSVFNTTNSWLSLTGAVRPSYTLFSEILSHLGDEAFQVSLKTPSEYDASSATLGGNLYAIATVDKNHADRADLMMVNLNATTNVTISPRQPPELPLIGGGTVPASTPTELWLWQGVVSLPNGNWTNATVTPVTASPVATYFAHGIPSNWTLPYQSVALFEAYPSGGVPVQFNATGFAASYSHPRWYVDVGGTLETANGTSNMTIFLPEGPGQNPRPFSVSVPSIPLKDGWPLGANNSPEYIKERLEPFLSSNSPLYVQVSFVHQWLTNISAVSANDSAIPSVVGCVTPAPQWWNASSPLTLTEHPAFHYAFTYWQGFGKGSVTNTTTEVTLVPTGWIAEKAIFTWGYSVTFTESGLPSGTNWSVTMHSRFNLNSTPFGVDRPLSSITNTIGVEESNGTYGFSIGAIPGYRPSLPNSSYLTNSSVNVSGRPVSIAITFTPVTPPVARYSVRFVESGLPDRTPWWLTTLNVTSTQAGNRTNVTVTNLTTFSETNTIVVEETNGTFDYRTWTPQGFRARPPAFGYQVTGPGLVIPIQFLPVRFDVIWKEAGLGPNLSWSVTVNNDSATTTNQSVGTWTTLHLVNGTYAFVIPTVADYVPVTNSTGLFAVNGANVTFNVLFPQVGFPVTFAISNLPRATVWQIRFSNLTSTLGGGAATFYAPNGCYTFDVVPPTGYLAYPSHGTITVDSEAIVINVSLLVDGPSPCPPIWNLACPAMVACAAITLVGVGTLLIGRARGRRRSGGTS